MAHLKQLGIVAQDLHRLLLVRAGVGVDLLAGDERARLGPPARVPDARGGVPDDQHDPVAGVLELAQLAEHDRVAQMDVRGRRVDPELDAQRPAERQLALELALRKDVDGVGGEIHGHDGQRW